MAEHVLDASAILALIKKETGWERVEEIPDRLVSAVNLAETASFLARAGYSMEEVAVTLAALRLRNVDFDVDQAMEVARLRPITQAFGLSVGDRACLALAAIRGLPALTTERLWAEAAPHVTIIRIR